LCHSTNPSIKRVENMSRAQHTEELRQFRQLAGELFLQLNTDQQQLYTKVAMYSQKYFPHGNTHPLDPMFHILSFVHCFLAFEKINSLMVKLPQHVGRSRPVRIGVFGDDTYGHYIPLFDMFCREKYLKYEFVSVAINEGTTSEAVHRYKPEQNTHLHFINTNNFSVAGLKRAFKLKGIDTSLGFDICLIENPNQTAGNGSDHAFLDMFNSIPAMCNPHGFCQILAYQALELHRLLEDQCRQTQGGTGYFPYELLAPESAPIFRESLGSMLNLEGASLAGSPIKIVGVKLRPSLHETLLKHLDSPTADIAPIELLFKAHSLSFPMITSLGDDPAPLTPATYQFATPVLGTAFCTADLKGKNTYNRLALAAKQLYLNGHYNDALCAFELLLPLEEAEIDFRLHFNIARCALKLHDFDKCQKHLAIAAEHTDNDDSRAYYATCQRECEGLKLYQKEKYVAALTELTGAKKELLGAGKTEGRCAEITAALVECEKKIAKFAQPRITLRPEDITAGAEAGAGARDGDGDEYDVGTASHAC
jgi:hypothetical protein